MKLIITFLLVVLSTITFAQKEFQGKAIYHLKTTIDMERLKDVPEERKKRILERMKSGSEKTFTLSRGRRWWYSASSHYSLGVNSSKTHADTGCVLVIGLSARHPHLLRGGYTRKHDTNHSQACAYTQSWGRRYYPSTSTNVRTPSPQGIVADDQGASPHLVEIRRGVSQTTTTSNLTWWERTFPDESRRSQK